MNIKTKFNVNDIFYANLDFEPVELKVKEVIIRITPNETRIAYVTRHLNYHYAEIIIKEKYCFENEEKAKKNYIHNRQVFKRHDFTI